MFASKTFHRQVLGNLSPAHPNYLVYENYDLYLNMVDSLEWLPKFADPMFEAAFAFIEKHDKVAVRCDMCWSRSPSIVLAYLAPIFHEDFEEAIEEFKEVYPLYNPGPGPFHYLRNNWERFHLSWYAKG